MIPDQFRCYLISRQEDGRVSTQVTRQPMTALPPGQVLIQVDYSSLNYKDALAATGHSGVVKRFPHVPGIDAAGTVADDASGLFPKGTPVIVTGFELGSGRWGGYARFIRVPAEWVVPLPQGLSLREAMILGTAGFTAARCVRAIQRAGVVPGEGEVLVTGATGGVGSFAVSLLSRLGYRAAASTGKPDAEARLRGWGAKRVISREEVMDRSGRPLLSARWASAVETVGGQTLASVLKTVAQHGCVAACGMVSGHELSTTVYPFILRGITLAGIDSAYTIKDERLAIWQLLATDWKPDDLEGRTTEIGLEGLDAMVRTMLRGGIAGRTLVRVMGAAVD